MVGAITFLSCSFARVSFRSWYPEHPSRLENRTIVASDESHIEAKSDIEYGSISPEWENNQSATLRSDLPISLYMSWACNRVLFNTQPPFVRCRSGLSAPVRVYTQSITQSTRRTFLYPSLMKISFILKIIFIFQGVFVKICVIFENHFHISWKILSHFRF